VLPVALMKCGLTAIRAAYESLAEGDVERLVSLIHPTMEWRGRRSLRRLFWPPS